jgi:Ser/Thr protein kinase RdoA (MazF antagonist)
MVWLPDAPAFAGLRPPALVWKSCAVKTMTENHQAWSLFQANTPQLDWQTVHLQRLQTDHSPPYGFYRLQDAKHDWFVKLVSPENAQRHNRAQTVADFLAAEGQSVPQLIADSPQSLTPKMSSLVYPYHPGRFSDYSQTDLAQIGTTIGRLHRALQQFPESEAVKQAAIARKQMLCARWQTLLQQPEQMQRLPEAGQTILHAHSPDWLWHLMENAQMVHGDLNVGNLWFAESGELMVLDWEDSLTAWFDPLKDLAFVIERFVLTVHEPEQLTRLSHTLLDAYFSEHPLPILSDQRLVDLLQALAVRSLLILAETQAADPLTIAESEWQKFCFLYKLTQQYEEPLKQIASPYVATA